MRRAAPRNAKWIQDRSTPLPNGCWQWDLSIDRWGYGKVGMDGVMNGAHRLAWRVFYGGPPANMTVDHTCFNRACVNPDHLRLLSNLANSRNSRRRPGVVPDNECINGHEWNDRTIYIRKDGRRACRICTAAAGRRSRARRREQVPA